MHKSLIALIALPLIAANGPVGRTLHYERTNHDGSEAEQIYVHRAAPETVAVYKMVERCKRSALVTATIDPVTGEAQALTAAQLMPGAKNEPYASVRIDGDRLKGAITSIHPPLPLEAQLGTRPWHMYDFDLATLSAAFEARRGSRAAMRFGMAMAWNVPDAGPRLLWLGDAEARFVRAERHLGRRTLRFEASGVAFGPAGGGPLWVDAREGFLVDVRWGRPNHDHYKDFRLRLIGPEASGAAAWTRLLERHYAGCPTP